MNTGRLVMERTFAATLDEVWALWTTPAGIESWWGPDGFAVSVRSLDLRPGGRMQYVQTAVEPGMIAFMEASGMPVATELQVTFREVVPLRRLVYTTLADFIPGVAPYDADTEVELEQVSAGVRLTLRFDRMHDETWTERAAAGWTSELARLERRLSAEQPQPPAPGAPGRRHRMSKATPFLMFNDQLGAAVELYTSIFPDSRVIEMGRAGDAGPVISAEFVVGGQRFSAYNGGPHFAFSDAFSILITCEDQAEVDRYWEALVAAGSTPVQCGWITDPYGLSWQIVPQRFFELIADPAPGKAQAVMAAMMTMVKFDIAGLERAHADA